MAGLGQSLKKALFVLVVLLACSTKPVRGFPFEWWRVRVWEGKFYYNYRSGYWQELMEWETESLQEAFISEPEMAVYIIGQSQMNWGNVGDWPPYWNVESQQWSFCGRTIWQTQLTCGRYGQVQSLKQAPGRIGKMCKRRLHQMPANGTASGSKRDQILVLVLLQGLQEANPGAEALHSLQKAQSQPNQDVQGIEETNVVVAAATKVQCCKA